MATTKKPGSLKPKKRITKYHQEILNTRKNALKNQVYDMRYGENWGILSKKCKDSLNGKCCYPNCKNNAKEAHHAVYQNEKGAIAGREIIGEHIFPLCMRHHVMAHNGRNWTFGKMPPPKLDSCNTPNFIEKMKKGFKEKPKKINLP
jgi:hypothetical protein